jgi:hypothetical protein
VAAEEDAADALIATAPVTLAGMRGAIEHIVKYDEGCEPVASAIFWRRS